MIKLLKNEPASDLSKALSLVLRVGLLLFLFGFWSLDSDANAIAKLYLISFLAVVSLSNFLLTQYWREYLHKSNRLFVSGLVLFILLSLITFGVLFNPNNSLLGGEGYRLGYLVLISAIAVGMSAKLIINRQGLIWFYIGSLVMLVVSIYFHFGIFHSFGRLAWPIILSNNLALMLAAAFMAGIYLVGRSNWWIIVPGQVLLLIGIVLTQSRAVLLITIVLGGMYLFKRYSKKSAQKNHRYYILSLLVIGFVSAFIFLRFAPPRLKSPNYLITSVIYRLELQKRGLELALIKPLTGIGPDAVKFYFSHDINYGALLESTVKKGYKFMSVHSIYLDKFIEYGLLVGLIFCALVARAIKRGYKEMNHSISMVALVIFVLFCLYGFFDFFSIETMVLFWLGIFYLNISSLTKIYN